ncbi:PilZ domain-containing protein [Desulfoluna sp.]|uniref:PilZ domain-containing protein n=1 Tax=Desulfoluna sp. TaxID=2045199 RepID=UPI0026292E2B|nr:PilZ domain-containing protein [Desulfoluna sp.]
MEKTDNKRHQERHDFDTPVVYTDAADDHYHDAMMCNFSDDGMCFESDTAMEPGTDLYVKTVNFCSINQCKVAWCHKIGSGDDEKYDIGLKCEI